MHVLQLNNYHFVKGGAERYYFEVSKVLEKHGNRVLHFSVEDKDNVPSAYSAYFGRAMSFDTDQGILKKIETASRMLYSFENKNKMKNFLAKYDVDIAHAHNIYHRICPSVFDVLRRKNIPIVMTLHDYKLGCSIYTFYRDGRICNECLSIGKRRIIKNRCTKGTLTLSLFHWLEAKLHGLLDIYNKNVSFFICPSLFSLKKHAEIGIPENKLIHISNFISVADYEPDYENQDYILFVGRLSQEKGILTLLKAVKDIDLTLKVVGDGPMREEYEAYARNNKINNVVFEGYKSDEDLRALFKNAAFLVIPSEWYENAPMTILESFAYGKPVIGADIGGIPEMVLDGRTGLLFKSGDYLELHEKIKYLLVNPSTIAQMGKESRKKAEEEYNSEVHHQKLMKVYESASA